MLLRPITLSKNNWTAQFYLRCAGCLAQIQGTAKNGKSLFGNLRKLRQFPDVCKQAATKQAERIQQ